MLRAGISITSNCDVIYLSGRTGFYSISQEERDEIRE